MSRSAREPGGVGGARSASNLGIRPWHVGCSILGSGCLYLAPIEQMPRNTPPEIVIPTSERNTLVLIADVERARVTAVDPDGDLLFFDWSGVPADVEIAPEPPFPQTLGDEVLWTSIYEVPRDPRLDGRTISVTVSDLEDEVTIEWVVKVEE